MDMLQGVQSNPLLWIALATLFILLILLFLRRNAPKPVGGWKGPFYVNPADPALFVHSRWGRRFGWFGYTLNFGNRWSWLVLAVIVVLSLAPFWYIAVTLRQVFSLPSN